MSARASAREQPHEREVARLWEACAAASGSLTTTQDQRIRALYPRRPSAEAGPDFRDALLLTQEGVLLQGDVEIHLRQEDWQSHGHHLDPRYKSVVLHAVLWPHERETSLERGARVPVVTLRSRGGSRGKHLGKRPKGGKAGAETRRGVPLLSWYRALPPEEMGLLLDRAGDQRFLQKNQRLQQALLQEPPDQVLYGALLDGLGYSQNREAFQALGRAMPWGLLQERALHLPPTERR